MAEMERESSNEIISQKENLESSIKWASKNA